MMGRITNNFENYLGFKIICLGTKFWTKSIGHSR